MFPLKVSLIPSDTTDGRRSKKEVIVFSWDAETTLWAGASGQLFKEWRLKWLLSRWSLWRFNGIGSCWRTPTSTPVSLSHIGHCPGLLDWRGGGSCRTLLDPEVLSSPQVWVSPFLDVPPLPWEAMSTSSISVEVASTETRFPGWWGLWGTFWTRIYPEDCWQWVIAPTRSVAFIAVSLRFKLITQQIISLASHMTYSII